ncbi:MAG: hypothetical protein EU550_00635, partial [Promethearchaeota archaeon]
NQISDSVFLIFEAALNNLEYLDFANLDEEHIYIYLLIKILLYLLNENIISNKVANLYSKVTYQNLIDEDQSYLYDICNDLGIDLHYYRIPVRFGERVHKDQHEILETNFSIHYVDYLKLANELKDRYRKLINNPLSNGYIFILKRRLVRLLQEYVRKRIKSTQNQDPESIPTLKSQLFEISEFKKLYENIKGQWESIKGNLDYSIEFTYTPELNTEEIFPPCIREILQKLQNGVNLGHTERLFLVFFLHALEYPIDKIIDLFSLLPDFDRDKTEYQVKFAKRKEYSPHSCVKLKSLNLCKAEKYKDNLCLEGYYSKKNEEERKIQHPLFYVQMKQYRSSRNEERDEEK